MPPSMSSVFSFFALFFRKASGAALLFGKQRFFLAVYTEISAKNPACKYRRDAKAYAMS